MLLSLSHRRGSPPYRGLLLRSSPRPGQNLPPHKSDTAVQPWMLRLPPATSLHIPAVGGRECAIECVPCPFGVAHVRCRTLALWFEYCRRSWPRSLVSLTEYSDWYCCPLWTAVPFRTHCSLWTRRLWTGSTHSWVDGAPSSAIFYPSFMRSRPHRWTENGGLRSVDGVRSRHRRAWG